MSDSPRWERVIGILGGLGPHAHVEFEIQLLSAAETQLGRPLGDQDYPSWVLSSIPGTADRTRAVLEGTDAPVEALARSARRLKAADFGVIPCNAAHAFLPALRAKVELPFLDMVEETAARALALETVRAGGKIGLLAATGTLRSGLYPEWMQKLRPEAQTVSPLDLPGGEALQEEWVMEPIFGPFDARSGHRLGGGIKSGAFRDPERREILAEPMRRAARRLAEEGASVVLTACTEIPLVLGRDRVDDIPLLDPMAAAAEACIQIALGTRPLPS